MIELELKDRIKRFAHRCVKLADASFVSKICIVVEECDESDFWLEFIIDAELLPTSHHEKQFQTKSNQKSLK